jgi:glycosyltransferase involved in cell wall biosynthesis
MTPFFSVIIPVYNRATALKSAIASVLAQTCPDFEIIVVDDGSADNPRAVVESFGDSRILFITQANAGGGAARNTGIDRAQGRFTAFLDSDDVFLPHHLAAMKILLDGTTDTVGFARVRVNRGEGRVFLKPPRALRSGEDMGEYLLCDRGFTPTSTLVVPRQAAARVRFDEHLKAAEDTDLALRLAHDGWRFQMLESPPGAVWRDTFDPNRLSAARGSDEFRVWLEKIGPILTRRAWHGARGWAYAKLVARMHGRLRALPLTLTAILRGCYTPKLACVVLLQVMLDERQYRALADRGIRWFHMGLREKCPSQPARRRAQA